MPAIILTSSFNTVAGELREKSLLPATASVVFIPTAGDPYPERPWIDADRKALVELGYSVTDVSLEDADPDTLEHRLAPFDVIFVAGGNTTYLVQESHRSGFHDIVRNLLKQGKLYIGSSAGSILVGPSVEPFIEEDLPELPKSFVLDSPACLGLVDYIILPHYPGHAESNDHVAEKYKNRFTFVKLTDHEYRTVAI